MKTKAVYILGFFENQQDDLFQYLKARMEPSRVELYGIELYGKNKFGSYSFFEEVQRIQKIVDDLHPVIIIAHSLGAYLLTQIQVDCPVILLDPSLDVGTIILSNIKYIKGSYVYDDGQNQISLSSDFIDSIKIAPTIEDSVMNVISDNVWIFGTGEGGYRIAIRYNGKIPQSKYILLQNADHKFSNKAHRKRILEIIKKQLESPRVAE